MLHLLGGGLICRSFSGLDRGEAGVPASSCFLRKSLYVFKGLHVGTC